MTDVELEPELRALRDDLRTARAQQRKLARIGQALTFVLVVVFVAFTAALYKKLVVQLLPAEFRTAAAGGSTEFPAQARAGAAITVG